MNYYIHASAAEGLVYPFHYQPRNLDDQRLPVMPPPPQMLAPVQQPSATVMPLPLQMPVTPPAPTAPVPVEPRGIKRSAPRCRAGGHLVLHPVLQFGVQTRLGRSPRCGAAPPKI